MIFQSQSDTERGMQKHPSFSFKKSPKDILQELGCSFKSVGQSHVMDCPKCGKPEKLYVRKSDGRFVCWSCKEINNFYGKIEYLIPHISEMSFEQARYWVNDEVVPTSSVEGFQVELENFFEEPDEEVVQVTFPEEKVYPDDFRPIDHPDAIDGKQYLESRGIPLHVAQKYEMAYSINDQSVIFPAKRGGILVGWQGRIIKDITYIDKKGKTCPVPKAKTSSGLKRAETLLFGDRIQAGGAVIVCEGPIDAIKCDLCPAAAVATFGKNVTKDQINMIAASGAKEAYIALDPDAEVESAALKVALEMKGLICKRLVPPPEFKDLGEMSFEQVLEQFNSLNTGNLMHFYVRLKGT